MHQEKPACIRWPQETYTGTARTEVGATTRRRSACLAPRGFHGRSYLPGEAWPFSAAQEPLEDGIRRRSWGGVGHTMCRRVVAERLCVVPTRVPGRQAAAVARSWDREGKRHLESTIVVYGPSPAEPVFQRMVPRINSRSGSSRTRRLARRCVPLGR